MKDRYTPKIINESKTIKNLERAYKELRRQLTIHAARFTGDDEALDIVHDSFIKAMYALHRFEGSDSKLRSWLYTIVHNNSLNFVRRKKNSPFVSEGALAECVGRDELFGARDKRLEYEHHSMKDITAALEKLPDMYKETTKMRICEERTYEEIAEMLDLPLGTVKARIHRGRRFLQKHLA